MQQASPGSLTISQGIMYPDSNSSASNTATSPPSDSLPNSSSQIIMDNDVNRIKDSQLQETHKRAVYRHPLFPLLALLFEKCEIATQSSDVPSAEGFNVDINAFVQHQEQDSKPFFSEDSEVDALMIKAIQVLRIHLLELEKVQELCKDFCNRYITCLKGKMQSENLLRSDYPPYNTSSGGSDSDSQPSTPSSVINVPQQQQPLSHHQPHHHHQTNGSSNNLILTQHNSVPLVQNPAATVYQMLHTSQGILAQPLIQTMATSASGTANHHGPQQQPAAQQTNMDGGASAQSSDQQQGHVVHGSTPLSQIGAAPIPPSPSDHKSMVLPTDDDFDDYYSKKKLKRGVLPKHATTVMRSWLFQHIVHPYPTEDEKRQLASQTHLTLLQVNNWFINARRRIIQPMLDASNPDNSAATAASHKNKKSKTHNSRTVQRFWPDNIANLQPQFADSSSPGIHNGDKNDEDGESDSEGDEDEDDDLCDEGINHIDVSNDSEEVHQQQNSSSNIDQS